MHQSKSLTDSVPDDSEYLRTILTATESGMIEISRANEVLFGNRYARQVLNIPFDTDTPLLFTSILANHNSTVAWQHLSKRCFQRPLTDNYKRKIDFKSSDNKVISCEISIIKELNTRNDSLVILLKELDELGKTRQRLERLNKQFKIASESAQIGIWNHDFHLNYTEWDSQMHSLYGVSEQEYDGTPEFWESRVHPDDLDRVKQELNNCINQDAPLNTQFRIIMSDGSERTLKAYGYCQSDEYGRPDSVIGVNYDITEQLTLAKHAEHESRFKQAILDGANYSIISTDMQGSIVTLNRGAQQLLKLDDNDTQLITSPLHFHLPKEIEARRKKLAINCPDKHLSDFEVLTYKSAAGEADEREWTYKRSDDTELPIMLSVTSLTGTSGSIDGFLFIGRSLDDVKWHERESKRIKKLLETTEHLAMLGGWEYDITEMDFHCSNGIHEIFATSAKETLSLSTIIERFPTDVQRVIRQAVMRAIEKGIPWDLKLPYRRSNGNDIWLRSHGHAEFLDGKATHLKGAFQDISAMKRAEEKAKSASLAKSEFLANMSHELRTPINGIIGMTQLLMKSQLTDNQAHYAKLTKMSADALLTLVNDILDFSKVEAGKLEVEKIDVNLPGLMEVITESFAFKAEENGITLNLTIDNAVPVNVVSDPTRLRQVLNNLISNALKFTTQGAITVSVNRIDKTLMFSVEDTGIGIPADKVDQLFDKFTQLDTSTTRQYGGSGLGLAISKQLTQLMGGEIGVTSVQQKGSVFWFTVTLIEPLSPPINAVPDTSVVEVETPLKPLDILLVEDNYINQQVCIEFLVSLGHAVTLASDGNQALDRLYGKQTFDVVLMDCQMPVLDGYETTKRIRRDQTGKLDKQIPIVALTANAMEDDRQKCLQCGMNYYLAKPFNIDELSTILNQLPVRTSD